MASHDVQVINNTIYATGGGAGIYIVDKAKNATILNNIILHRDARAAIAIETTSMSGLVSDYNVFSDGIEIDGDLQPLSVFKAATKTDSHSVLSDAVSLWVNIATRDFHLKPSSPAVGSGTSAGAPSLDFAGTPRVIVNGKADAGAYQH